MIQVVFALYYEIRKYKHHYILQCKPKEEEKKNSHQFRCFGWCVHLLKFRCVYCIQLYCVPIHRCFFSLSLSLSMFLWLRHNAIYATVLWCYHGIQLTHCNKLSHHMGNLIFKQIPVSFFCTILHIVFSNLCAETTPNIRHIYKYNSHVLHLYVSGCSCVCHFKVIFFQSLTTIFVYTIFCLLKISGSIFILQPFQVVNFDHSIQKFYF